MSRNSSQTVGAGPESEVSSEPGRLRATELEIAKMRGEMGTGIGDRITKLETKQEIFATREDFGRLETAQKSLATKVDVERAKNWGLTSIGAAGMAVLVLVIRLIAIVWPD